MVKIIVLNSIIRSFIWWTNRILQSITEESVLFSSSNGVFRKTDYNLENKANLTIFQSINVIEIMFSYYKQIRKNNNRQKEMEDKKSRQKKDEEERKNTEIKEFYF